VPDKLVKIAVFDDSMQADLAKQTLEDHQIKAVLLGDNAANIYPIPILAVELHVPENDAEKAVQILQSSQNEEQK